MAASKILGEDSELVGRRISSLHSGSSQYRPLWDVYVATFFLHARPPYSAMLTGRAITRT